MDIDSILTNHLPECRTWVREGRDFAMTFLDPSSDCGGHWCTWLRLSSPPIGPQHRLVQVLIDHDGGPFEKTLVVGRPLDDKPGAARSTYIVDYRGQLQIIADPAPSEHFERYPMIRSRGLDEPVRPRRRETNDGFLRELCERHHGAYPHREDDGIWSFLIPL